MSDLVDEVVEVLFEGVVDLTIFICSDLIEDLIEFIADGFAAIGEMVIAFMRRISQYLISLESWLNRAADKIGDIGYQVMLIIGFSIFWLFTRVMDYVFKIDNRICSRLPKWCIDLLSLMGLATRTFIIGLWIILAFIGEMPGGV